jgi:hypothetical protein
MGRAGTGQSVPVIGFFALELIGVTIGGLRTRPPKKAKDTGKNNGREGKGSWGVFFTVGSGSLGFSSSMWAGRYAPTGQARLKRKFSSVLQGRPGRERGIPRIQNSAQREGRASLCSGVHSLSRRLGFLLDILVVDIGMTFPLLKKFFAFASSKYPAILKPLNSLRRVVGLINLHSSLH